MIRWHAADVMFFVLHSALMLFNCLGWIWARTRPWHLLGLALTAGSWFVLGYWYGWGYCICTDWHFQIRRDLGYQDGSNHYVQLLMKKLLGVSITPATGDLIVGVVFAGILLATLAVHLRAWYTRIQPESTQGDTDHAEPNTT